MTHTIRQEVVILVETNKGDHRRSYRPEEGESLSDLLRRLADEVEESGGYPPREGSFES